MPRRVNGLVSTHPCEGVRASTPRTMAVTVASFILDVSGIPTHKVVKMAQLLCDDGAAFVCTTLNCLESSFFSRKSECTRTPHGAATYASFVFFSDCRHVFLGPRQRRPGCPADEACFVGAGRCFRSFNFPASYCPNEANLTCSHQNLVIISFLFSAIYE